MTSLHLLPKADGIVLGDRVYYAILDVDRNTPVRMTVRMDFLC
jgi:hypothetical protein